MLFAIAFLIGAMSALWREGNHMIAKLAGGVVVAFAGWGRVLHNSTEERSDYSDGCTYRSSGIFRQ